MKFLRIFLQFKKCTEIDENKEKKITMAILKLKKKNIMQKITQNRLLSFSFAYVLK